MQLYVSIASFLYRRVDGVGDCYGGMYGLVGLFLMSRRRMIYCVTCVTNFVGSLLLLPGIWYGSLGMCMVGAEWGMPRLFWPLALFAPPGCSRLSSLPWHAFLW